MNVSRWMRSASVQLPHGQFGATLAARASETRRNNAMKIFVRNAVLGAAAIATASLASPVSAHAGDRVAGALLGGFVAGALIGSIARPVYAAPVYAAPVYRAPVRYVAPAYPVAGPRCFKQRRTVWDPHYGYVVQKVKTCY